MRQIKTVIENVVPPAARIGRHSGEPLTLFDLSRYYPLSVRIDFDTASRAEVRVPYSANGARLLRECRGAQWLPEKKAWSIPATSARQLSEALQVILSPPRPRR